MLFKYFSYNKLNRTWLDSNVYISLCSKLLDCGLSVELVAKIHSKLTDKKLISLPYENFSLSDYSKSSGKDYFLYGILNNRRENFGKLHQLPSKDNANNANLAVNKLKFTNLIVNSNFQHIRAARPAGEPIVNVVAHQQAQNLQRESLSAIMAARRERLQAQEIGRQEDLTTRWHNY